ncbi:MAG: hypothetical protein KC964_07815 [Candidatus Omnitrophica bacterium]|nr:hypothetical protein [Candidatus Omnitrophota bacterium]
MTFWKRPGGNERLSYNFLESLQSPFIVAIHEDIYPAIIRIPKFFCLIFDFRNQIMEWVAYGPKDHRDWRFGIGYKLVQCLLKESLNKEGLPNSHFSGDDENFCLCSRWYLDFSPSDARVLGEFPLQRTDDPGGCKQIATPGNAFSSLDIRFQFLFKRGPLLLVIDPIKNRLDVLLLVPKCFEDGYLTVLEKSERTGGFRENQSFELFKIFLAKFVNPSLFDSTFDQCFSHPINKGYSYCFPFRQIEGLDICRETVQKHLVLE